MQLLQMVYLMRGRARLDRILSRVLSGDEPKRGYGPGFPPSWTLVYRKKNRHFFA